MLQVFIEVPLCTQYCFRHWGQSSERKDQIPEESGQLKALVTIWNTLIFKSVQEEKAAKELEKE